MTSKSPGRFRSPYTDNMQDEQHISASFIQQISPDPVFFYFCRFMPPDDPLGRSGPTIDDFLRRKPRTTDNRLQHCPYGKFMFLFHPTTNRTALVTLLVFSWKIKRATTQHTNYNKNQFVVIFGSVTWHVCSEHLLCLSVLQSYNISEQLLLSPDARCISDKYKQKSHIIKCIPTFTDNNTVSGIKQTKSGQASKCCPFASTLVSDLQLSDSKEY